jgi:hypothetical protein
MPTKITECVGQDKSYSNKDSKRIPTSQESDDLILLSDDTNEFISNDQKSSFRILENSTNSMTTYGLSYSHVVTPRNG